MPRGQSWRNDPRWQYREDNEDVHMRPQLGKLIHKIQNLKFLEEHPDSVPFFLQQIAYHYFVKHKQRPADAFQAFEFMYGVWQGAMGYPSRYQGEANDRQLEMAQNAVTGDDASKKLSLSATLREEIQPGVKKSEKRNNTTPGPSHKSPIAYSGNLGVGFTIPGIEGKFAWTGTEPGQRPPDMDKVIEILAGGVLALTEETREVRRSPEIDLTNKDLRRRVRKIIWEHSYDTNYDDPTCSCGAEFDIGEEWASHVRKLIWKELRSEESSQPPKRKGS